MPYDRPAVDQVKEKWGKLTDDDLILSASTAKHFHLGLTRKNFRAVAFATSSLNSQAWNVFLQQDEPQRGANTALRRCNDMTELHTEPTAAWAETSKLVVERAGAEFVGIENGSVLFRANASSPTCKLYPYALKSTEDVLLALKAQRERQKEAQWEFAEPVTKERNA